MEGSDSWHIHNRTVLVYRVSVEVGRDSVQQTATRWTGMRTFCLSCLLLRQRLRLIEHQVLQLMGITLPGHRRGLTIPQQGTSARLLHIIYS